MKKIITFLLCLLLTVLLVACTNTDAPDDDKDFEDAQKNFDKIQASTDKEDIEKTIKDVFGVDISLPDADSYSADTMEISGSSMYVIMISGSKQNAEQYYNSVKSKFDKWTAVDVAKTFAYETEKVTYGVVIEDDNGALSIVFSMTDKELMEELEEFVGDTSSFRAEIKKRSGLDITFPEIITSIGLPSASTEGAKVEYSGMLLAGGANLDAGGFQTVIDALTSQLTGYTKGDPIQGENSTTVQWINDADPTKYFEIVLSDYEGSTWVDFGYVYEDRSLLDPWPATELESFLGAASVLPEYTGDYRSLEVTYSPDSNDNYFKIALDGATEEEFNVWLDALVAAGFTQESVEQSWGDPITQYTKQVNDGLYLIIVPRVYTYGGADIELTKEVFENLDWPVAALATAYGQEVADAIPQISKASKRSFIFEEGTYSHKINVENNVSMELYDAYLVQLAEAGFEKTYSNDYSNRVTYTKIFDNWDELKISVDFLQESYGDAHKLCLDIEFKEYTGYGVSLPENVKIVYQMALTIGDRTGEPSETVIIKNGENYYIGNSYGYDYYYKFDAAALLWMVYEGDKAEDGTITWNIKAIEVPRSTLDANFLKNDFSSLRKNMDATATDPAQTKTVDGVSCTKYSLTVGIYNYEYWVDEMTGLVFEYSCIYEGGATQILITDYDTSVTSLGDIKLPQ